MTQKSPAVGIILGITALVVLIPVLLQMRTDGRKLRNVWGHFVFVTGMLCVAAGYAFFADARQRYLAIGGLAAALLGLFVQHRDKDSDDIA
ncbi:MAG: hypothetical protein ABIS27_02555 [Longimicrobiales bacterium]